MRQTQNLLSILVAFSLAACGSDHAATSTESSGGVAGALSAGGSVSAGGAPGAGGLGGGTGGSAIVPNGSGGGTSASGGTVGAGGASASGGAHPVGTGGSTTKPGPEAGTVDAFNGMCTTARWSTVSPQCWSCWCSKCAASLNAAPRPSLEMFECMLEKKLIVNNRLQLSCEGKAGQQECVNGDTADWNKLVTFDACLYNAGTATEFRTCDNVCGITYSGDVCMRYP